MEKYIADSLRYENGMQYERCGQSGVLLPKVSLGFWHNFGGVDPYERSREITASRTSTLQTTTVLPMARLRRHSAV